MRYISVSIEVMARKEATRQLERCLSTRSEVMEKHGLSQHGFTEHNLKGGTEIATKAAASAMVRIECRQIMIPTSSDFFLVLYVP